MNEELTNAYSRKKFLELEVIQANAKVERVASKKLDEVFAYQKPSSDRSGLGYTEESSSSSNVSKEMKFVKAKEHWYQFHLLRMWRLKRNQMWWFKRFWQSLQIHLWPYPRQKGSLFRRHKEVLKLNTFAIIVESEDTLGQIAKSFKHWRKRVLKGQEDKERARGTTSNQKGEK